MGRPPADSSHSNPDARDEPQGRNFPPLPRGEDVGRSPKSYPPPPPPPASAPRLPASVPPPPPPGPPPSASRLQATAPPPSTAPPPLSHYAPPHAPPPRVTRGLDPAPAEPT